MFDTIGIEAAKTIFYTGKKLRLIDSQAIQYPNSSYFGNIVNVIVYPFYLTNYEISVKGNEIRIIFIDSIR